MAEFLLHSYTGKAQSTRQAWPYFKMFIFCFLTFIYFVLGEKLA